MVDCKLRLGGRHPLRGGTRHHLGHDNQFTTQQRRLACTRQRTDVTRCTIMCKYDAIHKTGSIAARKS